MSTIINKNSSFYSNEELQTLGLKSVGQNVLISRKCSIYTPEKISIGNDVRIDDFCFLSGNITLGSNIHISIFCGLIGGTSGIVMEDFSGLSSRNTIYADTDDYSGDFLTNPMVPEHLRNVSGGLVTLEKHVIVGAGCIILPNLKIGEGSAVGSMSLVARSLPEWMICFGIPAKPVKARSKELLKLI